jgi:hypothetical protein
MNHWSIASSLSSMRLPDGVEEPKISAVLRHDLSGDDDGAVPTVGSTATRPHINYCRPALHRLWRRDMCSEVLLGQCVIGAGACESPGFVAIDNTLLAVAGMSLRASCRARSVGGNLVAASQLRYPASHPRATKRNLPRYRYIQRWEHSEGAGGLSTVRDSR